MLRARTDSADHHSETCPMKKFPHALTMVNLSTLLHIDTKIARADGLTLNEDVPIDGFMSLEIQYLP